MAVVGAPTAAVDEPMAVVGALTAADQLSIRRRGDVR
jgi:hypothetical protein